MQNKRKDTKYPEEWFTVASNTDTELWLPKQKADFFNLLNTHFLPRRNSPQWARDSSISTLHDHTQTHHTW